MKRTIAAAAATVVLVAGLVGCGKVEEIKDQACTALSGLSGQVSDVSSGKDEKTVGDATTALTTLNDKLTTAKNSANPAAGALIEKVQGAITTALDKAKGVDPSTPLKDVPALSEAEAKIKDSFSSVTTELKCA
ncbi:MAG: hypothetical protein NTZ03_12740 [Actinobacteria bacterium]|nr:hypothetical protein [Actinomycetota bacterium]